MELEKGGSILLTFLPNREHSSWLQTLSNSSHSSQVNYSQRSETFEEKFLYSAPLNSGLGLIRLHLELILNTHAQCFKCIDWAGEMAQELGVPTAVVEDWRLAPRTHFDWLTVICNSKSRRIQCPLLPRVPTLYIYAENPYTDTHANI